MRRSLDGFASDDWHRDQRLTRSEALELFTSAAAFAAFAEADRGSITAGRLADFTVLSADPLQVPEPELPALRAVMTIVGGAVVFAQPPAGGGRD